MKYAIYSYKQREIGGLLEYLRPDGSIIKCTCVGDTPDCGAKFDDIVQLGEVTKFIRRIEYGDSFTANQRGRMGMDESKTKKASELLLDSAEPFDKACVLVKEMEKELEILRDFKCVQIESSWQPIETAPHDREVLIFKNGETYCGYWATNAITDDVAWVIANFGEDGDQLFVKNPTHWMPLPSPPEKA